MNFKDILYYLLIFACFIAIGYLISYSYSEGRQCLKNPYIYGASKMGDVDCSCIQHHPNQLPATFSFNGSEFNPDPAKIEYKKKDIPDLNFSGLKFANGS